MVAAVQDGVGVADEARGAAGQEGQPVQLLAALAEGLPVADEGARDLFLVMGEDVEREAVGPGIDVAAARVLGGRPEDQGRGQGKRGEAVGGDAHRALLAEAGHDADARGKGAQRVAEAARVVLGVEARRKRLVDHGTSRPRAAS